MEVLLKTFKESDLEYAKNLLDYGDLFFQHVTVYQEIEDNEVCGDKSEGQAIEVQKLSLSPNIKKVYIGNPNGSKQYVFDVERARENINELKDSGLIEIRINYTVDWLLYRMTYINNTTNNIESILKNISKFGKYCVVITDCKDFISKVNGKIKTTSGLVEYSNLKSLSPIYKKRDL